MWCVCVCVCEAGSEKVGDTDKGEEEKKSTNDADKTAPFVFTRTCFMH